MADNLLDKASILLTPTAYNDGSMLSVKPENGDGDFTFSRSSAATRVNAQGLVENVQTISSELVSNGNFSQIGTEEVSNGNFSQEGSELVTNGDFATDTDWTKQTSWSISGGSANYDFLSDAKYIRQTLLNGGFVSGKTYKINFEITSGTAYMNINSNGGGLVSLNTYSVGSYSLYTTASVNGSDLLIYGRNTSGTAFSIDNVSVKEVGQDWTIEDTWTIGDGVANGNGANGNSEELTQLLNFDSSKKYEISYEISNYVSGSVRYSLAGGGGYNGQNESANGTYVDFINTGASHNQLKFFGLNFIGSITNISVKEVGQDWTFGSGWSVDQANSKAVHDSSAGATAIQSTSVSVVVGKKYELKYTASNLSGGYIRAEMGGLTPEFNFSDGTYTYNFTATTNANLYITASANVEVTNVSVKEITDDTDLPRINYEGFSYQDSLGSELVVNGTFDDGLNGWSTHSGSTLELENGMAKVTTSNNSGWIKRTDLPIENGKTYFCKADITNAISKTWYINGTGNIVPLTLISGNTYGGYVTITGNNQTFYIKGNNTNGEVTYIDNVSVKEVLGQEVVPDSGCGSWLLEPQSTNLIPYSEDFSQWSLGTGGISIETGYLAPDGSNNATKVTMGSGFSNTALSLNASLGETDSRTIYARTVSGTGQAHLCSFNGNSNNLFDITEQWQRFEVSEAIATGVVNFYAIDFRGNTTLTEILIWGAQAEQQSYATSYIPTSGATNTRLQDIANNSGNSTLINSTEGVLYAEIAALANTNSYRLIDMSDGGSINRIYLAYTNSNNKIRVVVRVSNSDQFDYQYTLTDATEFNKIAFKYKENDFALWVNGTEVYTDSSGITFPSDTLNVINFSNTFSTENFFVKAKAVAVFKEALTDAQLQSLTTT